MKYEYGNVEYEGDDFYCYPGSSVLMNKFNIRDSEKLQEIERDISFAKIAYLGANPLKGDFDLTYLQKIHRYIFEDVYSWAGKIRGGKFFFKGETAFCVANMIPTYAESIFENLRDEKWIEGLEKEDFVQRLAYYMGEINALHPFREGNGRMQRIFFAELARRGGYKLNFSQTTSNELLEADISAYNKDYSLLISLLERCCDKSRS